MSRRAALLLIATAVAVAPASAVTRRVPSGYPTIQGAISAAVAGDTVLVAAGTYTGAGNKNVDFLGKAIVVRSESGAEATILNCEGSHRGFFFHSGETNASILDGFTIENGYVSGSQNGGGIECEFASPTIRNCIVRDCMVAEFGSDGGGICCRTSTARIEDCVVSRNYASYGGGIACRGDQPITILRCTVTGNTAVYGGGIDAGGIGAPRIESCVISGNESSGGPGGNPSGGGLLLGGAAVVVDCVVTGNRSGHGGGVLCGGGTPVLAGCTIASNRALGGSGGGLASMGASVSIDRTILWDNCADGQGDDILAEAYGVVSYGCCIVDRAGVVATDGVLHDLGNNLDVDPLFCGPVSCLASPTTAGDYSVSRSSSAFPGANPCVDWIGALRVGCPAADVAEGGPGRGVLVLSTSPNPATERLNYRFDLPRAGITRLSLLDASGRRVRDLLAGDLSAGPHEGSIVLRSGGPDGIASGAYFLRLVAPGGASIRRVVIAR